MGLLWIYGVLWRIAAARGRGCNCEAGVVERAWKWALEAAKDASINHGNSGGEQEKERRTSANPNPQAPEIQSMYTMNLPVSTLRTKIRQEFERHRYVSQIRAVDVLLFHSHQEFQVGISIFLFGGGNMDMDMGLALKASELATDSTPGNTELLETAEPRAEVFPS